MFDTLLYAKKLEASGLSREQAEAQIQVMTEMIMDGVATKQDIAELKLESMRMEHRLTIRMGGMIAASMTITIAVLTWVR